MKLLKPTTPKLTIHQQIEALALIYLTQTKAVWKFKSQHERTFTEHDALAEAASVAENELRSAAKVMATSYQGHGVDVEYVMPKTRYLDPVKIKQLVPKAILDSLSVITTVEKVDQKALNALVRLGKIKKEVLTQALVEIPTDSPRVTIRIKD